jgi:hypothetical protein
MFLHYGDLSDSTNLFHIISEVRPHEVYNLGAMSHVAVCLFHLSPFHFFLLCRFLSKCRSTPPKLMV